MMIQSAPPSEPRFISTMAEHNDLCGQFARAFGNDRFERIGWPGEFPFTRGVYPSMYRGRLWTMRQFAGFGTAEETNERFRYLLEHGQTGLSTAFDMPTLMGYDSDHPRSLGEVGRDLVRRLPTVRTQWTLVDHGRARIQDPPTEYFNPRRANVDAEHRPRPLNIHPPMGCH